MPKIPIDQLSVGMRLAKDVILDDGRFLLLKGFTIKPRFIHKLKAYKIDYVFVEEEKVAPEVICEERLYEDAYTNIKGIMESVRLNEKVEVEQVKETVHDMVHYILNDDLFFMTLTGIRDIDNYTFLHSVDVCIYTIITCKAMDMSYDEIYNYALAAIFHDIGKCKIPLNILNKPGKLTPAEFEVMKDHSRKGSIIAKSLPALDENISKIICQHHEKWDGTGYPYGLKGEEINLGARIISVADVYDALTANRVYRKRFMPHEAAEYLLSQNNSQFDPYILKCFIDNIAVYPQDIIVLLNTGEVARVLPSKGVASIRPKVFVITKKDGPPVFDPYEIDLSETPSTFVVDIIG